MTPLALLFVLVQGPTFSGAVLSRFDLWDADRDGALSMAEIDRAALSPRYRGEDAAALAALHLWLSSTKEAPPRLTKAWFAAYRPVALPKPARGTPRAEAKQARKAYEATPGSLQSTYVRMLGRLSKGAGADVLYENGGPTLADIRQGGLGDCYMLAPLGALLHRDPEEVRRMIRMDGDGYTVQFGDGKTVRVTGLSDAEVAMGGANSANGLWVRVLEKAFGSRDFSEGEGESRIARDGLRGGKPGAAGKGFTGHHFTGIALVGDYRKTEADLDPRLARIRRELPSALAARRLVLAATPHTAVPKSITGGHAYAVFDYDAARDRITLWNPHGNDFRLQGTEGLENGFARSGGVFSMPLPLFARTFSRIIFEDAAPG